MSTELDRSFAIVANGFADGPAQALRDYLVERGARVITILHPLTREQGSWHRIATYAAGRRASERVVRVPLGPPLSYLLDPFVPLAVPPVDVWFGFNPLACARGLLARKRNRARLVVLWSVDFTPDRFGPRNPATRIYDWLDRLSCIHADAHVELSEAARAARSRRLKLPTSAAPTYIVPMGAWIGRTPKTDVDGFRKHRVVFLGHLNQTKGLEVLLHALSLLRSRGDHVVADIIGTGPLESSLRAQAESLGLREVLRFHGFVSEHREVERLLADASVAVAPYRPEEGAMTAYADPGKLKAYLAAGLPIVMTEVPPNASELASKAGAEIVSFDENALAKGIASVLNSPVEWRARRRAALAYAGRFDWSVLFEDLVRDLLRKLTRPETNPIT